MTREDLEHIIRASADLTDQYEFIIVGSQSILGPVPHPEAVFTMSAEADIYPFLAPDLADRIDGAIGEGSQVHETNGYYAQGVGPQTAILPAGWMQRVHRIQNSNTNGRVGYCLSVADLFMSKAAAGRDKDRQFCMALLAHGYVTPSEVLGLVPDMPWTTMRSAGSAPPSDAGPRLCARPGTPSLRSETDGAPMLDRSDATGHSVGRSEYVGERIVSLRQGCLISAEAIV